MTKNLEKNRTGGAASRPLSLEKMEGYLHLPSNSVLPGIGSRSSRPAVFLDRDGVLVEDVHYLTDASQLKLLPGVTTTLSALQDQFLVVVVTNQSGIARGFLTEENLTTIHTEMVRMLADEGVRVDALYYCPHLPEATVPGYGIECECRKPMPGMLLQAAKDWPIDLSQSFMVGDSLRDIQASHSAGVRGVMVAGNGSDVNPQTQVAPDLAEAAKLILGEAFFSDKTADSQSLA